MEEAVSSKDLRWIVHKFGGTSVASADRYRRVAQILESREEPRRAVVVSAMGGVTDVLVGLVESASQRNMEYKTALETLRARQLGVVAELLDGEAREKLLQRILEDIEDISDLLRATWLMRSYTRSIMEIVSGYGELWSAQVLRGLLDARGHRVCWMDAREVLTVEPTTGTPNLLWETCQTRLDAWVEDALQNKIQGGDGDASIIITGFIASTQDGTPTTLGRNGSDYSASIFSALLKASDLTIWTDVNGVLSANPKLVQEAVVLDALSYQEAMELAYFGAKVLHPATMAPAVREQVKITIKNTFEPEEPGTEIHATGSSKFAVKGFATIDNMALLNLEGNAMMGVPGIASKLFDALREEDVSVVMISQASSEHSICFVIHEKDVERAQEVVEQAFFVERHRGQLQSLEITRGCSILAAVGDNMAGVVGIASKFFTALGKAQVNIRAIAQGSSERNISVVIDGEDATRALRAVHSGFYLSHQTLSIGILGAGGVGSALLDQLSEQTRVLRERFNVDLRVRALATSQRMLLEDHTIDLTDWRHSFEERAEEMNLEAFLDHIDTDHLPHTVILDCTASDAVASRYAGWMERGIHVITPNKKANTRELAHWKQLKDHTRRGIHYLYETTVGAGLPIIQTLRDLVDTGDEVERIEGVLSGTLSYLFNTYDGSVPFSQLVRQARELGYTEPDPREDLSGLDVARKIVILAREIGENIELEDVNVRNLVPDALADVSVQEFMEGLSAYDEEMKSLYEEAREEGCVLRFVGSIDRAQGVANVELRRYEEEHALSRTKSTDNIVQFTTRRYSTNPLVVQGPGAGPDVTAAGVFADLLRLSSYLGVSR